MNNSNTTSSVKVIQNKIVSEHYKVLQLEKYCDFKAGQIIGISLQTGLPTRMYSIASGERDESIDILYSLYPNGEVTPQLWQLKAGDTVQASHPSGRFEANPHAMTWIAAGTGIAPFVAMLRSAKQSNIQLIHGARQSDEFYNAAEFDKILGSNYIRCISQPTNEPNYFNGRVSDYLRTQQTIDRSRYYLLCGGSEMVVEVRDLLLSRGVSFLNIAAEIYF